MTHQALFLFLRSTLPLLLIFSSAAQSAPLPKPQLIRDLNQTDAHKFSSPLVIDDTGYFLAENLETGNELWKTDGTAPGTSMVKDLMPGPQTSNISNLTEFRKQLYFCARGGTYSRSLFKTDGTSSGTVEVADLTPYPTISLIFPAGDSLILAERVPTFTDATVSYRFWRFDGTNISPQPLLQTPPGFDISGYWTTAQGIGYFLFVRYDRSQFGMSYDLYRSDGTPEGTFSIPLGLDSNPVFLTAQGPNVFFSSRASAPNTLPTLWKTDGTAAGTLQVSNKTPTSAPVMMDGTLYFTVAAETTGTEIWKIPASSTAELAVGGLKKAKSLVTASVGGDPEALFFVGSDDLHGDELWKSDGTPAGTSILSDTHPGPVNATPVIGTTWQGDLYFTTGTGSVANELWRTDGTAAGTTPVRSFVSCGSFRIVKDRLIFSASEGPPSELWTSDGTDEGSHSITHLGRNENGVVKLVAGVGDRAIFYGLVPRTNGSSETKPFSTDGVTMTALPIVDGLNPGIQISDPGSPSILYFLSTVFENFRTDLWRTDGTSEGTFLVKEMSQKIDRSTMLQVDHYTLFQTQSSSSNRELWRTDGTEAGTVMLIGPSKSLDTIGRHGNVGLFFYDSGLWRTDGTPEGTARIIQNVHPRKFLGTINGFTCFITDTGSLLRTDSTVAGTTFVKPVDQGEIIVHRTPSSSNGVIYFSVPLNGQGLTNLWRTDGTSEGTFVLKTMPGGPLLMNPVVEQTVPSTKLMYFWQILNQGRMLWVSDGTSSGTVPIESAPHSVSAYFSHADSHFFVSRTLTDSPLLNTMELWKSDGTEDGTTRVLIDLDSYSYDLSGIMPVGEMLYLPLTSNALGTELYKIPLADLETPADLFRKWASAAGLTGEDQNESAIPLGDGVSNLLKYAFFMNANVPDNQRLIASTGTSGLPVHKITQSPDGRLLRLEYIRRKNAGLIYRPVISTTLEEGSFKTLTGGTTVTEIDADRERVVVEHPVTPEEEGRAFVSVKVSW